MVKKDLKRSFFIKNEGFVKLRKKKFMVIFQNGFSPKAASQQPRVFGDPRLLTIVTNNPKIPNGTNTKFKNQMGLIIKGEAFGNTPQKPIFPISGPPILTIVERHWNFKTVSNMLVLYVTFKVWSRESWDYSSRGFLVEIRKKHGY